MCKKSVKQIILITVSLFAALIIFTNYVIDPKMENNYFIHSLNSKKSNFGFYSSKILYDKLKTNRYSLVFGTSRTARITKEMMNEEILNFSTSLYAYPEKVYNFLMQLDEKQLSNINTVYYLLDFHVFGKVQGEKSMEYDSSLMQNYYSLKTFDKNKVVSAFQTLMQNFEGKTSATISEFGYETVYEEAVFDPEKSAGDIRHFRTVVLNEVSYDDRQFEFLKKIDDFCKNHTVKIVYFTAVFNDIFFKAIFERGYFETFVNKTLSEIDSFYSFLYIDGISNNYTYFFDVGHYNKEAQRYVLEKIKYNDESFIVTGRNKDEYLKRLKTINDSIDMKY